MSTPTYKLIRNDIVMVCETSQAEACGNLIVVKDRNKSRHSDWWGHPKVTALPDGSTMIVVPSNINNLMQMKDCGAKADRTDKKTMDRLAFFMQSGKSFATDLPLMPFQNEGGEWLVKGDLRRILAYTMGLGKTITAIAAIMADQERYLPAIVMAPAHVKLNWASEWKKWGGDPADVVVLFGQTPHLEQLTDKKLIVLNHHILKGWLSTLEQVNPKTMIIDEAHNFVNSKGKTYKLADKLAKACRRRVLMLTATPLVNDLSDLWGLTTLISKDILGTKQSFMDTVMPEEKVKAAMFAGRWRGGGSQITWKHVHMARLPKAIAAKRLEELGSALRQFVILRKEKADVYTELPSITESKLCLEISRTSKLGKDYWKIEDDCADAIVEAKEDVLASAGMLPAFGKARMNSAMAKLPDAIAWIEDFLAESGGSEKLVVVGWSVKPLETLHNHFKKQSLIVNGKIDAKKKFARGDQFRDDPKKRILFGNVKSIGTGLDQLVSAATMLFIELPLTAVDFEQVKGRIDRLSQVSNSLAYYYMTIRGSVEENMVWKIISKKTNMTKALGL